MNKKTLFTVVVLIALTGAGYFALTQERCEKAPRLEAPGVIPGLVERGGKYFLCKPMWQKLLETIVKFTPAERPDTVPPPSVPNVPIANVFLDKIVYTSDQGADVSALRADCAKRGGEFRECGSPCPRSAEVCVEVCAFTCELSFPR